MANWCWAIDVVVFGTSPPTFQGVLSTPDQPAPGPSGSMAPDPTVLLKRWQPGTIFPRTPREQGGNPLYQGPEIVDGPLIIPALLGQGWKSGKLPSESHPAVRPFIVCRSMRHKDVSHHWGASIESRITNRNSAMADTPPTWPRLRMGDELRSASDRSCSHNAPDVRSQTYPCSTIN